MVSRAWVFTLNNPTEELKFGPEVKFATWQLEQGENGTNHYQGYIIMAKPTRLTGMKKVLPRAHLEIRRGTHEEAAAYANKADTRLEGPWTFGAAPTGRGARTDLNELKAKIDQGATLLDVAETDFGSYLRYHQGIEKYVELRNEHRNAETAVTVSALLSALFCNKTKTHASMNKGNGLLGRCRQRKNPPLTIRG